jgi:hypothetical protein
MQVGGCHIIQGPGRRAALLSWPGATGAAMAASITDYAPRTSLDSTFCACWLPTTHLGDRGQLRENHRACLFSKPGATAKIISNRQTLFSNYYVKNQTFNSKLHLSLDFYQYLCAVFAEFLV